MYNCSWLYLSFVPVLYGSLGQVQCLVSIGAVSARDGKKHRSAPQSGRVRLVFVAPYGWRQL